MEQKNTPQGRRPAHFSPRPQRRPEIRVSRHTTDAPRRPTTGTSSGSPARAPQHTESAPRTEGTRSQRSTTRPPQRSQRGPRRNDRPRKGRQMTSPAITHRVTPHDPKAIPVPTLTDEDIVRIVPLGGVEEVGEKHARSRNRRRHPHL